jgi:hypothetical protein
MPDVPAEAVRAAMARRADLLSDRPDPTALSDETLTRLMLEAAAPILAGHVAARILAHAERQHPRDKNHVPTAWDRHFSIAARVAAGAFYTREDELRLAAQALDRGDVIWCNPPEVPCG